MFWFSGWKMCGIFAPWLGTEPIPNALEDKVLTTGPPGKSLGVRIFLAWIPINLYIATGSNKKKKNGRRVHGSIYYMPNTLPGASQVAQW